MKLWESGKIGNNNDLFRVIMQAVLLYGGSTALAYCVVQLLMPGMGLVMSPLNQSSLMSLLMAAFCIPIGIWLRKRNGLAGPSVAGACSRTAGDSSPAVESAGRAHGSASPADRTGRRASWGAAIGMSILAFAAILLFNYLILQYLAPALGLSGGAEVGLSGAGAGSSQGAAGLSGGAEVGLSGSVGSQLLAVLGLGTLAPITEEVIFRGMLFRGLRCRQGFWLAAILTSLAFAAMHGGAAIICTFVAGIILCALYERTGLLACAAGVHVANNVLTLFLSTMA